MQKINIHSKNKIDKNKLESKIKELLINDETYRPDVSITIYEGEINSIYFTNPEIQVFCELFAYENPDISDKKNFLKEVFFLLNKEFQVLLENVTGVIHQLNQDHYITQTEDFTIENSLREDSFKTLGI